MDRQTERRLAASLARGEKPAGMSWPDYLIMLLHTGAEIEHCLMVQYLYAAYSLGGKDVPEGKGRDMVRRWRESILTIAREEMGHLLCIQNGLMLVGGPVSLKRSEFPAQSRYYPFAFRLEPLSLDSLACYVQAEMPPDDRLGEMRTKQPERYKEFDTYYDEIKKTLREKRPGQEHRVGTIYETIRDVVKLKLRDTEFHPDTFELQASWDEWGRGYQLDRPGVERDGVRDPQERHESTRGHDGWPKVGMREGQVIVQRITSRSQALTLLEEVAGQGEAPHFQLERNQRAGKNGDEKKKDGKDEKDEEIGEGPSHFDRFYEIYRDFSAHTKAGEKWSPTHAVPINPTTIESVAEQEAVSPFDGPAAGGDPSFKEWSDWRDFAKPALITSTRSQTWASLFNLRYRMLLTYLAHTYRLPREAAGGEPGIRNATLHRVFAEMYNLKTIAGILVQLPLRDGPTADDPTNSARAGPPFEMPYSLELPLTEMDCWELHKDLLSTSQELCASLRNDRADEAAYPEYLGTLRQLDERSIQWIESILKGLGARNRT